MFPIAVFGAMVLGIAASWYWSGAMRLRRALRAAPRAPIAEVREGAVVRIDGRVAEGETLVAPLTGRRCVYYVAVVERSVRNGWHQCVRETRGVPFAIDDGTGRAIVDPASARIDVDLDATSRSGGIDAAAIDEAFRMRNFLNRMAAARLRYREGVVEVGQPVAVLCQPVREADPDAAAHATGYRADPPTRLRVGGSAKHPLLVSGSRKL